MATTHPGKFALLARLKVRRFHLRLLLRKLLFDLHNKREKGVLRR